MPIDGFAQFRIEQADHRFLHLVDQLVNDAVKLDLDAFALGRDGRRVVRLRR